MTLTDCDFFETAIGVVNSDFASCCGRDGSRLPLSGSASFETAIGVAARDFASGTGGGDKRLILSGTAVVLEGIGVANAARDLPISCVKAALLGDECDVMSRERFTLGVAMEKPFVSPPVSNVCRLTTSNDRRLTLVDGDSNDGICTSSEGEAPAESLSALSASSRRLTRCAGAFANKRGRDDDDGVEVRGVVPETLFSGV